MSKTDLVQKKEVQKGIEVEGQGTLVSSIFNVKRAATVKAQLTWKRAHKEGAKKTTKKNM